MKLSKLALKCVLVLVVVALAVVPVQAGKPGVTQFEAPLANETNLEFGMRQTGAITHFIVTNSYDVIGGGSMLEGGILIVTFSFTDVPVNNHTSLNWFSGPFQAKWRIVTSGVGELETGWEGTAHSTPGSKLFYWNGTGFGNNTNKHIKFTYVEGSLLAVGEIWE